MKLFWVYRSNKRNITALKYMLIVIFLQSCATQHSQFGSRVSVPVKDNFDKKNISHTFYLIGDAGNTEAIAAKETLDLLNERLQKADSNSTLLFLGDNIYPKGMPKKGDPGRASAEQTLTRQLEISKGFKGKTIVIPGNHDWYSGIDGLKEEAQFVRDYLGKKSFLPRKSCGIDHININDDVSLIVIDSQWFLEDWDAQPSINDDCVIKTREDFFEELESQINKDQKKATIIAIHHPLMSNGPHGGEFSLRKHIFPFQSNIPLPVIGTVINLFRKTSGVNPQDLQNKKYNTLIKRIKTLIQDKENVVVVSGHEHNLQYIDKDNVKQIISGAGSKEAPARAINKNDFSYGNNGYAVLEVKDNGASKVSFFATEKGKETLLFEQQPTFARPKPTLKIFKDKFLAVKDTAIYTTQMTTKSGAYRFLWGNHYRKYYSTRIKARSVALDTLYGGLKPTIEGGGHQSKSLRIEDKNGREYVMRALRKSATRFLQSVAFKDQAVEKDFRNTFAEDFILDFYTTAHPYTPFVVGNLADKVGISHTNPKLFYVPKQNRLALFNENFGDELYMIEERPMDKFSDLESFGKPPKIVSTEDVLSNVKKSKKYSVDEPAYIRARIFDMLIGDWDRHDDQWRWGEYKENGKVIYRPIPRDRDQAFTKYDGKLLSILMNIPALRHMRKFDDDLDNVRWFNREAYTLDLALITQSDEKVWQEQAQYIVDHLSDNEIDIAFENVPKEVKGVTIDKIKSDLKIRKTHLAEYARKYYDVLQETVLVVGTENKDQFLITREPEGGTRVQLYSSVNGEQQLVQDRTYFKPKTKEIWLYGLDKEDTYTVNGKGKKTILIRLLGGQDNDVYHINAGKRVKIYDFKSKENTFNNEGGARKILSDDYTVNTYDYEKPKYDVVAGYPWIGYNPDDGVKLGAVANYTVNGFNRYPYTQRHSIGGNYYFATGGYEFTYKGIFTHLIGDWNLVVDAKYTSPNFSVNFFGFGNETPNLQKEINRNYNRVKIRKLIAAPSLQWKGEQGGAAVIQSSFQRIRVLDTEGRFISEPGVVPDDAFGYKNFVDLNAKYSYDNYDNTSNPTLGMSFSMLGGFTMNVNETDRRFPYAETALGFNYRLTPSGKWVLATVMKGKALFDDKYEFYQASTLGGDYDLRGFRNQRFSGKQSFYQSTDLRLNLGKLRTGIAPTQYGVFGGYDYGRVWLDNNDSRKWHQSFGGGIWINGVNLVTGQLSVFHSTDGLRISGGIGFGF